ncbi:MAG: glycoside hydrolase family 130 protein [Planctomycetaceae bacterium]|nr:glycoside hydrolase family 130 protein [Planctomycetaceae bacterium]
MMRFFWTGVERSRRLVQRLAALPADIVRGQVDEVLRIFRPRHVDIESVLMENAQELASRLQIDLPDDSLRQLLMGACASMEYAFEAAALFNPSMVPAMNQRGLAPGQVRILMSMRAVGEGHLSSIVFRHGTIAADGDLHLDSPPQLAQQIRQVPNPQYPKAALERKLRDMHKLDEDAQAVLNALSDPFSYGQLLQGLDRVRSNGRVGDIEAVYELMVWIIGSNYRAEFPRDLSISDYVLFPLSEAESQGMEDMRLVRFVDDDGQVTLYGTYTAFSGNKILPQMIAYRAGDRQLQVATLLGRYARDKGLALFPRKVNGRYMMLGRCNGESSFLLSSDSLTFWDEGELLTGPEAAWEIVQVGNCGSPIETPRGWLVLTHGVGPMRRYCIGAMLLDLEDPSRIIARLGVPLLEPQQEQSGGYVPNVVYSCGSLLHGDRLFIPYGISDTTCAVVWVSVDELLQAMG